MRRRDFIAASGAVAFAAAPSIVRAQSTSMPVIGILGEGSPDDEAIKLNLRMLRRGLQQEGFVDGQNVAVDYRWAHNRLEFLPGLAQDLVVRRPTVIVNEGGTATALAAKQATSTIPVVFHASDALADGLVDNLARPGGNLTGVSQFATVTVGKAVQLLAELGARVMQQIQQAGTIGFRTVTARTDEDLERTYAALAEEKAAAMVFANVSYAKRLVGLAARYRVPAAYTQRAYVAAGGLMSYGASLPATYVIKGAYAGRILKGAKPSDLPVQQPSKFELAINLVTAAALGITVPLSVLASADEVIE